MAMTPEVREALTHAMMPTNCSGVWIPHSSSATCDNHSNEEPGLLLLKFTGRRHSAPGTPERPEEDFPIVLTVYEVALVVEQIMATLDRGGQSNHMLIKLIQLKSERQA